MREISANLSLPVPGRVAEAEPKPGGGGGADQTLRLDRLALPTRSLRDHPPRDGEGEGGRLGRLVLPTRSSLRCDHPPRDGEGEARRVGVVAAARGWLGTPYRHQASVRGEGADCLGLVRGVWREVVG
jgi:hypothetical protein